MRIPFALLAVLLAFQANAQSDAKPENKITVSGRAWGSVEDVSTTGAPGTTPNVRPRVRVTNDSSFLRVRGDLKLSDDLSAFGQIESQFSLDGAAAYPFDSGRNTGVGFASKTFGTISIGRWDSPYKNAVINLDPWGDTTINSYANVLGQQALGNGNLYDARLTNGVQYWSPVISGLQVKVAAEVNEDRTANYNPSVLSASVTYTGPLYVGVGYETRKDCGAGAGAMGAPACNGALLGNGHGRDWGVRAGVGYKIEPTLSDIGVIWERLESSGDFPAAFTTRTLRRDAWYAGLTQGLGSDVHHLLLGFGLAQKASGDALATNDKTGAMFYTASYRYTFNKDLFVWLGFTQIRNELNAAYRFGSSGFAVPTGANANGWSLGTRYLF